MRNCDLVSPASFSFARYCFVSGSIRSSPFLLILLFQIVNKEDNDRLRWIEGDCWCVWMKFLHLRESHGSEMQIALNAHSQRVFDRFKFSKREVPKLREVPIHPTKEHALGGVILCCVPRPVGEWMEELHVDHRVLLMLLRVERGKKISCLLW